MKSRGIWLLRCSILINVATTLYICHIVMNAERYQQLEQVYLPFRKMFSEQQLDGKAAGVTSQVSRL